MTPEEKIKSLTAQNERLTQMVSDLTEFISFELSPRVGSNGGTDEPKQGSSVVKVSFRKDDTA